MTYVETPTIKYGPLAQDLQTRYSHWRKLERIAEQAYGPSDDLTTYYHAQRMAVETAADAAGIAVRHLGR